MSLVHIDQENFQKEVLDSDIPVLIDFYADWCMPCRMMAPVFESLSNEFKGKVKFVKVNTEEQPELSEQFEIFSIPTLVLVEKGKEKDRITGFMPKHILKGKVEKLIS